MADIPVDPRTDEELMVALCGGDRSALQTLHERHAPWLLIRLSRRCADPGIVDEVVQDTFLAVWRRPNGYRGTG
ncbi:MAG: RNA polymerase sigma factor, partial [Acidimicrobiales bacterium]